MVITRAAIMFSNGETLEGHTYSNILILGHKLGFSGDRIYGFVSSSGDFVLPAEAAVMAIKAGQIKEVIGDLTPEELWPSYIER